jgi:hypothetical protein
MATFQNLLWAALPKLHNLQDMLLKFDVQLGQP